jgi:ElaB/YqjD/DUF883 family membrane-anchored ribosome-binding protein
MEIDRQPGFASRGGAHTNLCAWSRAVGKAKLEPFGQQNGEAHMLSTEANKDIDHIRKDLASLRDDVTSLASSLKSSIKEVTATRGRDTLGRIEEFGERAKDRASVVKHAAERGVGEHPFATVLTTFGVGFLLGMLLDRRR